MFYAVLILISTHLTVAVNQLPFYTEAECIEALQYAPEFPPEVSVHRTCVFIPLGHDV
jgi:hypothetical protein